MQGAPKPLAVKKNYSWSKVIDSYIWINKAPQILKFVAKKWVLRDFSFKFEGSGYLFDSVC